MIGDFLNMVNAMASDAGNYESRKVCRDEVNGVVVSTAYTSDCGYETALLDKNGAYPVERYADRKSAELGHTSWLKKAETLTTFTELGYGECVKSKTVKICRKG